MQVRRQHSPSVLLRLPDLLGLTQTFLHRQHLVQHHICSILGVNSHLINRDLAFSHRLLQDFNFPCIVLQWAQQINNLVVWVQLRHRAL